MEAASCSPRASHLAGRQCRQPAWFHVLTVRRCNPQLRGMPLTCRPRTAPLTRRSGDPASTSAQAGATMWHRSAPHREIWQPPTLQAGAQGARVVRACNDAPSSQPPGGRLMASSRPASLSLQIFVSGHAPLTYNGHSHGELGQAFLELSLVVVGVVSSDPACGSVSTRALTATRCHRPEVVGLC